MSESRIERLEGRVKSLEAAVAQLGRDPLTMLPNRRAFEQRLTGIIKRYIRGNGEFAVVFFDLDGFKKINDTQGHQVGDQVLCDVASALDKVTRDSDMLARYAGDEFVAVIEAESVAAAHGYATRALEAVAKCGASVSAGVAIPARDSFLFDDLQNVVATADKAMYKAKRSGGARVVCMLHDPGGEDAV